MPFYINFDAPTLGEKLKVKEITFSQYKTLNKFLINNNNDHIAEYFDKILEESIIENDKFSKLTNFDKFCALFLLRCTCISPDIEYKEGPLSTKFSLLPFLKRCLDFKTEFTKTIKIDKAEVRVTLPKLLQFETLYDVFYDSISQVFFDGKEIFYPSNRQDLYDMLPAEITKHIKTFSDEINESFKTLVLEVGKKNEQRVTLSPYNLSLLEILKALYNANLKSILELQYILVSKLFYTPEYLDNNTLAENMVLANIYETEMSKLEKEQSKASVANPLSPNK